MFPQICFINSNLTCCKKKQKEIPGLSAQEKPFVVLITHICQMKLHMKSSILCLALGDLLGLQKIYRWATCSMLSSFSFPLWTLPFIISITEPIGYQRSLPIPLAPSPFHAILQSSLPLAFMMTCHSPAQKSSCARSTGFGSPKPIPIGSPALPLPSHYSNTWHSMYLHIYYTYTFKQV